jgi:cytoskeletal protein RodZ
MNEEPTNNQTPPTDVVGEEMKMPENSTLPDQPTEKPVRGPILLSIGVLLFAVFVGLVLWFMSFQSAPTPTQTPTPITRPTAEENNEPESTTAEAQTDNLGAVSTSDEISAIEADIEATDIEALDAELQAIEAELDAAF